MLERSELLFFKNNGYFKFPKFLQIEITDFCPLNCPQCYKVESEKHFMEESAFEDILRQAKKMRVEHIFFNGGEPLTHPKMESLICLAFAYGFEQTIFTSGYKMTEEFVCLAKRTGLHINLSLNGSSKEVNGLSRDGYELALQSARLLQRLSCPFQINWVARSDNVHDLPNLIKLGKQIGAHSINIVCNKMTSKGEIISPLSNADYTFLVDTIQNYPDYVMVQNCYGLLLALLGTPHNKLYGCQAGIRVMAVACTGRFMPCTHLHYPEAFELMEDYWEKSTYLNQLRTIKDVKYCNNCNYCRFCHSMSKESHDDFSIGLEKCPIRNEVK